MATILCGCYQNSSANSIIALCHKLTALTDITVVILAYGPAIDSLRKAGFDHLALDSDGLGGASLKDHIGKMRPDVVVVGTSKSSSEAPTLEQILTEIAAAERIPSVSLLDYVGSPQNPRYCANNRRYLPDTIVAPDFWTKSRMVEEGFPEAIIRVLGNPQYDSLVVLKNQFDDRKRLELRRGLGIPSKKLSAYLVQFIGCVRADRAKEGCQSWDIDYVESLCSSLILHKPENEVALILRVHPREAETCPSNWDAVIQKVKAFGLPFYPVDLAMDPNETSLACDLTVVSRSNIATQNVFMGLKTISIQLDDPKNDDLGMTQMGAIPVAYSKQEATDIMRRLFAEQDFWSPYEEIQRMIRMENDGKSGDKVSRLVCGLAGGSDSQ